jgi:hypothetical protein
MGSLDWHRLERLERVVTHVVLPENAVPGSEPARRGVSVELLPGYLAGSYEGGSGLSRLASRVRKLAPDVIHLHAPADGAVAVLKNELSGSEVLATPQARPMEIQRLVRGRGGSASNAYQESWARAVDAAGQGSTPVPQSAG